MSDASKVVENLDKAAMRLFYCLESDPTGMSKAIAGVASAIVQTAYALGLSYEEFIAVHDRVGLELRKEYNGEDERAKGLE